jgi:hypothetical protein
MNAGRAIRRLEQAGFTHERAAGVADLLQDGVSEKLATKEFVALSIERSKAEIELVVERGKTDLIRWMVGLMLAQMLGQTSLILLIGNMLWGQ